MSKTKPSGLIHYEILFIMPNKFTDDEAQKVFKKVGDLITSNEGKITLENYWGKKKFAYPINHEYYGYYGLYEFDLERTLVAKINDTLRLDKEIVRFLIVKKEVKSEEQIKKDKKIKEKIDSKKSEELKTKEEAKKETKKVSKKKEEDKKIDLKNLEEKLDDVLNIDNLL
ncbi:MAG TPA: 30S ribosomal protein S6 [bacterium]|nr:30S ribosomal protein S6 [bacterium]HPV65799.1 30S ribosomal protein S6 [bacterium]